MKVACIGNMNNNFYSLVRYLRDQGIDAHLLIFDKEFSHFHPSADSYDLTYQRFTQHLKWGNFFSVNKHPKQEIASSLESFDVLIGCGAAPAYAYKAGRSLDIFVPYGTDVLEYPYYNWISLRPKLQISHAYNVWLQRMGIKNAKCVNLDDNIVEFEKIFKILHYSGHWLRSGIPMIYTPVYNPENIASFYNRSQWYQEFKEIRDCHDMVIFHHARHHWRNRQNDINGKANDKLFRGFCDFIRRCPQIRACLVTCEYGKDVLESKQLISELGIESRVFWFPLMPRKDIMAGLSLSDIGSGEFQWSWLSCGTIYEVLAMARPLLGYREDSLYTNVYPELYPMINVKEPRDICEALSDYVKRPDYYKDVGEQGRQWFQRNVIDKSVSEYVRIIKESR